MCNVSGSKIKKTAINNQKCCEVLIAACTNYYQIIEPFVQTENCRQLTHPLIRHFICIYDDITIRHLVMNLSPQIKSVITAAALSRLNI